MLAAPPPTAREAVVDVLHGERVIDPYRWLEDGASERVRRWTDAQNERTRAFLDALPIRERFAARLRALMAVGLLDTPRLSAGRIFHLRRSGDQLQAALYVREGLAGADRMLVDPNGLDASGLTTLDWYYPSPDARYVAYGLSHGGTELSTLHVRDVASGEDLRDRIPHTRHASVAWVAGGFYYTAHPAPGAVPPGDEHYYRRLRFHRLGDDVAGDRLVFGEGRPKEDIIVVGGATEGRWILVAAYQGWARSDVYLIDHAAPLAAPAVVVEARPALVRGDEDPASFRRAADDDDVL
ncbi:MAG: prolyl oligopeptidase family serine peptidase, partial [Candidatus Limnocylindria bacterium]